MNKKCQVFTPEKYVKILLDSVSYKKNLYGKKILENSCGDGNILVQVVERYINDSREKKYNDSDILLGLERDIYGWEIDKEQYLKCINRLNSKLIENNLREIKWNILNSDFLDWIPDISFDFIIGNPPYVTYAEINVDERKELREKFCSCKSGKFDYAYAFIEKSLLVLAETGKMSYLIHSSLFKTVFGRNLREIMKPSMTKIIDYSDEEVFNKALVKPALIVFDKGCEQDFINYKKGKVNFNLKKSKLSDKWVFEKGKSREIKRKFGEYFQVSHSIATLYNKAFLLKNYKIDKDNVIVGDYVLEKDLIRKCVSPRNMNKEKNELIIFPYKYANGSLSRFTEVDLKMNYPGIYSYLKQYKNALLSRNADNNAKWFEYGRSQGIAKIQTQKLILSTVITDKVEVTKQDSDVIPYSGMFITPKKNLTLEECLRILKSDVFFEYAKNIGIPISGSSFRITSKDIMNFYF